MTTAGISVAGIAGVAVGDSEPVVHRRLGRPPSVRQRSIGYAIHEWEELSIAFDYGSVVMVIAERPTVGHTERGIAVGSSWRDLEERCAPIHYDEYQGLWTSPVARGIWYEVVRPATPEEQPVDPPFVEELYEVTDP